MRELVVIIRVNANASLPRTNKKAFVKVASLAVYGFVSEYVKRKLAVLTGVFAVLFFLRFYFIYLTVTRGERKKINKCRAEEKRDGGEIEFHYDSFLGYLFISLTR